jgi:hypothetical protein
MYEGAQWRPNLSVLDGWWARRTTERVMGYRLEAGEPGAQDVVD